MNDPRKMKRYTGTAVLAQVMIANRKAYSLSYDLLLDELSAQQREVFDLVRKSGKATTNDIAESCNISQSAAGTILLFLTEIGILERTPMLPNGYTYQVITP